MNLSFLKKLGAALAEGIAIATGFGPLIAPYLGAKSGAVVSTVINDLTQIGVVVVQVEAILQGTGTGPDKLKAAVPLVASIIRTSELVGGRKIEDEAAFVAACQTITSGVADLLNSLEPKVPTTGDPIPAPAK